MADPHDFDYRMSVKVRNLVKKAFECGEEDEQRRERSKDSRQQLKDVLQFDSLNKELISYEHMEILHKHLQRILPDYPFDYFYQFSEQFHSFPKQQSKVSQVLRLVPDRSID